MFRLSALSFLAALAVSHAEGTEICVEGQACDELVDSSSLLQKLPAGPAPSVEPNIRRQVVPAFASFIQQHSREYVEGSAEYVHRRSIYESRAKEVEFLNERPSRLWTAGVNHLSDWTDEELSRIRGWKGTASRQSGGHGAAVSSHGSGMSLLETTRAVALSDEVDWTHLNASKVIRNQGGCGSCWAFATVLALEANHEIHQKTHRTFSVQELVDCVPNKHNCGGGGGCDGATVELAVDYAIKHGLDDSTTSPYAGRDLLCSKDLSLVGGADNSNSDDIEMITTPGVHAAAQTYKGPSAFALMAWERLPENKYEPLMRAVMEQGPVAISVAATLWASYTSGIFDGCDADAVIDHAVTLVGYGKDDELQAKFWNIQNSWTHYWGEGGRIRLLRRDNDETQCGVDHHPEDGTACDGGPVQVTVCGMCGILYDTVVPHFSSA